MGESLKITIDLVLRDRARMGEEKVTGPEDAVVAELIKDLNQENVSAIARCFQARFMGQEGAPDSKENSKIGSLEEP